MLFSLFFVVIFLNKKVVIVIAVGEKGGHHKKVISSSKLKHYAPVFLLFSVIFSSYFFWRKNPFFLFFWPTYGLGTLHCPSIPMSIHWRHKVNNNIMYTFKCLPGRSQACNPRPPQLPCTKSQPADTALPGLTNNETPTTCSAVQNTMYKSKCLPGRSQACKPRPP